MNTIYHLSSCDTCRRILRELNPPADTALIDIKQHPLTPDELKILYEKAGSYEALFNKRARLFRERGLNKQILTEEDYKDLLLEHYTFLRRPVMLITGQIFIGNRPAVVREAKKMLHP